MAVVIAAQHAAQKHTDVTEISPLSDAMVSETVQLLKLLADDTRLRILHLLLQRQELNVRTLCALLKQSQPAVSHHLALLRVAGLIQCRREGKHNYYHLLPERFEQLLEMTMAAIPEQTCRRLTRYLTSSSAKRCAR